MKAKIAEPCPRCLELKMQDKLRTEMVQPLPEGAAAPLGYDRRKCCYDCAAADTLIRLKIVQTFEQARVAVGNERQEQYRLPGAPLGLVREKLVRPSEDGDYEKQHKWLEAHEYFGDCPMCGRQPECCVCEED